MLAKGNQLCGRFEGMWEDVIVNGLTSLARGWGRDQGQITQGNGDQIAQFPIRWEQPGPVTAGVAGGVL